ncbi:hypothetical protein CDD80_3514 [Ophiocordyceps camponoti-rufipedis]|uniref:Uncharacterized protein n=1 Tax=Ophiocordyceps camponoti-rufipedis TaxID=2004952 RepID=A0A2C5Z3F9_9HYPO|nr:hypothetical protein CDD80_3514 [Ophiocordyceps camponoti-rufipedis]
MSLASSKTASVHETSAAEVEAMDDSELIAFIKRHRDSRDVIRLPITDWDELSEDHRHQLGERIESWERWRDFGPEIEAYDELVGDGGRPIYSADLLLKEGTIHPWRYERLRHQWTTANGMGCADALAGQLHRWKEFRQWQRLNRGVAQLPVRLPDGLKSIKLTDELAQLERIYKYSDDRDRHGRPRREVRELACHDFPTHMEAVKRRLARHGLTRPLLLKEDAKEQDRLTTWMEYFDFEYFGLDKYQALAEEKRLDRDKAWIEIVAAHVVELRELASFRQASERFGHTSAELAPHDKAVEDAKMTLNFIYTETQEDEDIFDKMFTIHGRVESYVWDWKQGTEFQTYANKYLTARTDVLVLEERLQWILKQIPLIEAESEAETRGSKRSRTAEEKGTAKRQTTSRSDAVREPRRSARIAARHDASSLANKAPVSSGQMKKKKKKKKSRVSTGERRSRRILAAKGDEVQRSRKVRSMPSGS